jgi:hypothetical protein
MLYGHSAAQEYNIDEGYQLDLKASILLEVSACPRDSKEVLFHLASFLLEDLGTAPFRRT